MAQPSTSHKRPGWLRRAAVIVRGRYFVAGVLAVLWLCMLVLFLWVRGAVIGANDAKAAYQRAAGQLAATNNANCSAAGKNCVGNSKQVIKQLPNAVQSVVSPVIPKQQPKQGPPGRGIVSTDIDQAGHLIVHYTDGSSHDAGLAVGKDGQPGHNGRGIRTTRITAGNFVVTYTDGASKNLGQVVGPAGRGVSAVAIVSGHLIVTYSDKSAVDVGQVVGTDGIDGTSVTNAVVDGNGDLQVTLTAADGSSKVVDTGHVAGADGTDGADGQPPVSWTEHAPDGSVTQICQRSTDFDPASPTYECTAPPPTPSSSTTPSPSPTRTHP